MQRLVIILLSQLLIIPFGLLAATKKGKNLIKVEFDVVYSISERAVDPFIIEVYNATDSVKTSTDVELWRDGKGKLILEEGKLYKVRVFPTSFELKTDAGYEEDPEYEPVTIDLDLHGENKNMKIDQVRIHKKMHRRLDEVTVTSSRILFYHKGDTLVYKASELVLSEGSMIDALIKQLPGVTFKDNGEIFVNNRKVDDLLLNGKDLFNDNRQLMLENIGAYTVKDIAVYEKNTAKNEILGRDVDEKRFSMDVRLKRQYSIGWNINVEAGYGTDNRYLGKLFGQWFSDNASIFLRGNFNNLSSEFSNDSWTPDQIQPGIKSIKSGGISYMAEGQANKWQISGNADIKHTDENLNKTVTSENFLPGGSNYLYSFNNARIKQLEFITNHTLRLGFNKKMFLMVLPKLTYQKNNSDGSDLSALFSEDVGNITSEKIANIYHGYTSLADTLIYRNISKHVMNGHYTSLLIPIDASVNIGHGVLNLILSSTYDEKKDNENRLYIVNHSTNHAPTTQDFQQLKLAPDNTLKLKGTASYHWDIDWKNSRVTFSYSFENIHTKNSSNVSNAADWDLSGVNDAITIADLWALPGFATVFSPELSYCSKLVNNTHRISASFTHTSPINISDDYAIHFYANPLDLRIVERHYRYVNIDSPIKLKRSSVLPEATAWIRFLGKDGTNGHIGYSLESKDAPMQSMVTLPQIDPMNKYIGNPELKHSLTHSVTLSFNKPVKGQKYHNISLNAHFMHNAIMQGYVFNTVTGVKYYHPLNVDGNWGGNAQYEFFIPFGVGKRFNLKTTTSGIYVNSVDLIGTSTAIDNMIFDAKEQKRRYVKDLSFEEKLNFDYKFGEHHISVNGEIRMNDYRSKDQGFSNFTSWTGRYGVSGVFSLPAGFGISTDMNVYTRSGFIDTRLNKTDVVWNARLTKSIMKGDLTFAVDAYDILRQLSNITYIVNAQARTEAVTNVVPGYVLFHIMYRFNRQPKR